MMWGWIKELIGPVLAPATEVVKGWQARKQAKLQADLALNKAKTIAKINRIKSKDEHEFAWEHNSIDHSGWKDEWFTIVLSVPATLCFCGPVAAQWVRDGFAALSTCPGWYQWMLSIAVGSSFGYRKLADFMSLKKGA